MSSVMFIATEWGATQGGVNAFNHDLVDNCGLICKGHYRISCAVIEAAEQDIQVARQRGVKLISLRNELGITTIDDLSIPQIAEFIGKPENRCEFVVGHDIFTGMCAVEVARKVNATSVIFIHSNYGAYKHLQNDGDSAQADEKVALQTKIVRAATRVYGVGPLLTEAARNLDGSLKAERRRMIRNFVPGLPNITATHVEGKFTAITFGRFEQRNLVIKQQHLSAMAYAKFAADLQHDQSEKRLTVVGLSSDRELRQKQISDIREMVEDAFGGADLLSFREFLHRSEAFELLTNSTVALMPSLHEGFGLVGWEAIAAGVPLILSEKSGLFRFLDENFDHLGACYWPITVRGTYDGSVNEADIYEMCGALSKMHAKMDRIRIRARMLRMLMMRSYSWKRRSRIFLKRLDARSFRFDFARNKGAAVA